MMTRGYVLIALAAGIGGVAASRAGGGRRCPILKRPMPNLALQGPRLAHRRAQPLSVEGVG